MTRKQLAFLLARQQTSFETDNEEINDIMNNTKLSEHFKALARDLDIMEAKTPEDIYKSHLENIRTCLLQSWSLFLLQFVIKVKNT